MGGWLKFLEMFCLNVSLVFCERNFSFINYFSEMSKVIEKFFFGVFRR